ncbi:hypothetical protein [Citrobacter portucalensis]|uniref:hypothetical protein n=1 Tax=Citrobacter portucalensis TaxID=1639133 RepID=UPI003F51876C
MSTGLRFTLAVDGLPPDALVVTSFHLEQSLSSLFTLNYLYTENKIRVRNYLFPVPGWIYQCVIAAYDSMTRWFQECTNETDSVIHQSGSFLFR